MFLLIYGLILFNGCVIMLKFMEKEEREKKGENKWLKSVQNKFKKLISDLRWDSITLTGTEMAIVTFIMNAKTANDLPVLINERIVDHILEKVKTQFKHFNTKGL